MAKAKMRYSVYDATRKKWLMSIRQPDKNVDVVVTKWTNKRRFAMFFPGVKTARSVIRRMGGANGGDITVCNARGDVV